MFLISAVYGPDRQLEPIYTDPQDRFWHMYMEEAHVQDKQKTDRWKGDTDGILIFVRACIPI